MNPASRWTRKSAWQRWASNDALEELTAVRRQAIAALADAGVPSPGVDVDLLLCHVLGIDRSELKLRELRGEGLD
ncbi:hypothetical protein ACIP6D_04930, partial [Glutamicibacter sp. NPDC088455]